MFVPLNRFNTCWLSRNELLSTQDRKSLSVFDARSGVLFREQGRALSWASPVPAGVWLWHRPESSAGR
jgi:hypothetical protein